ncbi:MULTISPECIES: glycosyltransferase family 2 protein [Bacillaceae]|uniref:glycosyltransferase family 2 protein n=1 Tax=Bacillaceae TaxID=186817 RepID=UPI00066116B5|nr:MULTISPECIES: glycosyltransferase family 2 protein [Bacillaceae]MCF2649150.1 glycosyltransferase family 2 protein [Niallia circulans]
MEKVSICICTRNRPIDLKNAIYSIFQSTYRNFEVIVSDDSTNDETKKMIEKEFSEVKYVKGPRKGLCFNRNNALKIVTGSRVLFMDDDVKMSKDFLKIVNKVLLSYLNASNIIITGIERNKGTLVLPNNVNFLGHQAIPYNGKEELKTIVINSTLFPASLFEFLKFDEQLVYGYDEVDIATRAKSLGYKIILCEEAINDHYPSSVNREFYRSFKEASRIYVTYKKYYYVENKKLKSGIYLFYSLFHTLAFEIKENKISGFKRALITYKYAINYIILNNRSSSIAEK